MHYFFVQIYLSKKKNVRLFIWKFNWDLQPLSTLQNKTYIFANSVDLDETAHMSHLIRICTICHSVFDFRLKPLLASIDKSKVSDGKVHFRNSG